MRDIAAPLRRGLVATGAVMAAIGAAVLPAAAATAAPSPPDPSSALPNYAAPRAAAPSQTERLQAEVDRLKAEVAQLETDESAAVEAYDTAHAELQVALLAELSAATQLDQARVRSAQARGDAERRVRALYVAGPGADTPLAALSGNGDLVDVAVTMRTARALLDGDTEATAAARSAVDSAVRTSSALLERRAERVSAQQSAEQRAVEVRATLARRHALLRGTDAALVAAIEQERQDTEALALAWALTEATGVQSAAVPSPEEVQGLLATAATAAGAAGNPIAARAISAAGTRLGLPYTWGATGPATFDCSGLTQWAYAQAGRHIPRTSRQQFAELPAVGLTDLQPGDLVFYASGDTPGSIHHFGLYVGGGLMIHAPRTGDVVRIAPIDRMPLFGAVRPSVEAP